MAKFQIEQDSAPDKNRRAEADLATDQERLHLSTARSPAATSTPAARQVGPPASGSAKY